MKTSKLFQKTLFFMILVFGIIAVSTSYISGRLLHSRLMEEYKSKAEAIAGSLADSGPEFVLGGDAAELQARVDEYLDLEGVAYTAVTDETCTVLAHTFVPAVPEAVRVEFEKACRDENGPDANHGFKAVDLNNGNKAYHIVQPILAGALGYVHVGMDTQRIESYIRSAVLQIQGITLVIFLACVAAAYLFIGNISRPLLQLADYARKVADHDFSSEIEISSRDEVGILASAMKSMAGDLSKLILGLETSVKEATDKLQDTLVHLSTIIGNIADGLLVVDHQGRIVKYNNALLQMYRMNPNVEWEGRDVGEVLGAEIQSFILHDGKVPFKGNNASQENNDAKVLETRVKRMDGTVFPIEISSALVEMEGRLDYVCVIRDISQRKKAEEALKKARDELEMKVEERTAELSRANAQLKLEVAERKMVGDALRKTEAKYRSIFENAVEGIYQTTPSGRFVSANPSLAKILGYTDADELIKSVSDVAKLYMDSGRRQDFHDELMQKGEIKNFEARIKRKHGDIIWISESARIVNDSRGEVLYFEGTVEDISLRKQVEEHLVHRAYHDALTNLPNRALFLDHLRLAGQRAERRKGYLFAVLYLDLDRFKIINDSLGHDIGDELLKALSEILKKCVRSMDTVARFGGDEFAVLLEEITAPREAVRIARRILQEISKPFNLNGHEVYTSASIGIVLYTEGYDRPESILRDADTAMYRAKESGRSRFKVFNQKMHEEALEQLRLETDLRRAVDNKNFVLHYQPIISLEDKRIVGLEALLRWSHPEKGLIPPLEFLNTAEDTGLINPLGDWVLTEVIGKYRKWKESDLAEFFQGENGLSVNVNISGKQILQPFWAGKIEDMLLAESIDPGFLKLEIKEKAFMRAAEEVEGVLNKLKEIGLGLVVDDFGTGFSSLTLLQRFPIETIKVDRNFVARIKDDADSQDIVKTVISLGLSLGLNVAAEGVETVTQLDILREFGCPSAQGFLFSKPLSEDELERFLRTWSSERFDARYGI